MYKFNHEITENSLHVDSKFSGGHVDMLHSEKNKCYWLLFFLEYFRPQSHSYFRPQAIHNFYHLYSFTKTARNIAILSNIAPRWPLICNICFWISGFFCILFKFFQKLIVTQINLKRDLKNGKKPRISDSYKLKKAIGHCGL